MMSSLYLRAGKTHALQAPTQQHIDNDLSLIPERVFDTFHLEEYALISDLVDET